MSRILKEIRNIHLAKKVPPQIAPLQIDFGSGGKPAIITFSDAKQSFGSCIRCINSPCIEYSAAELELDIFQDFPSDKNNKVCPTLAITWFSKNASPVIDNAACIMCGLCVSRCPVGAIYLNDQGVHVNDEPNAHFVIDKEPADLINTTETTELFATADSVGVYCLEDDRLVQLFRSKIGSITQNQGPQFPNHLARNLLLAVGIGALMRRRGDVYLRMDLLLGPPGVERGTGEVEFGGDILDAPRNILDSIAVLVARYEFSKEKIVPLIVTLELPNLRSEYWQFIKDVNRVLNIKINSITIGALVLLLWNRARISISDRDEFYVDVDSPSLRPQIELILGRALNLTGEGYPGLLENGK